MTSNNRLKAERKTFQTGETQLTGKSKVNDRFKKRTNGWERRLEMKKNKSIRRSIKRKSLEEKKGGCRGEQYQKPLNT